MYAQTHSPQGELQLYIIGDNEAVIKVIIKGRSPTMRHVSRTHRVALDWLFHRINLGSKIQIKSIDTKNQLADILTEGNFTRDEWNHLLCLFNIQEALCYPFGCAAETQFSVYNWNPGPRWRREDAFEHIAGRWHVITLQEASEYVDHELLTNRFHVTHHAGCAVLFKMDTFHTNVDVKSTYIHDTRRELADQVLEGEQGWVRQGVLSRASFRRSPVSGQKYFTVLSLHISNIYAKKSIAKKVILALRAIMISEEVDLVAGDFIGTAWQYRGKENLSTIDEALTDSTLPTSQGRTPLWRPGSIPDMWADVCGFLKPPGSQRFWKAQKHGAFSIPGENTRLETE